MNLIIVGCGRIGSELAQTVMDAGHQVAIIDHAPESFERLGTNFEGRTICGDVLDKAVLQRAGINEADGLAAVTSNDATNFVAGRIAKEIYQVENVVVRAYDPRRRAAFESLGIRAIASSSWGAQRLTQLLTLPEQSPMMTFGHGEVSLAEIAITEDQNGKKLSDFQGAAQYPVAVIRSGEALLPNPELKLQVGDLVVVSLPAQKLTEVEA